MTHAGTDNDAGQQALFEVICGSPQDAECGGLSLQPAGGIGSLPALGLLLAVRLSEHLGDSIQKSTSIF